MNLPHLLVLGALEHLERASGYDIDRYLRELTVHQWTDVKRASIYHALRGLEIAGHVAAVETLQLKGFPEKTMYSATPAGQARFDELQRQAALGLYPSFLGFKLALKLNKRASREQLGELAAAAVARIVELERKMDAELRTVKDATQRDVDAFFFDHDRKLLAAERAWIEESMGRMEELAQDRKAAVAVAAVAAKTAEARSTSLKAKAKAPRARKAAAKRGRSGASSDGRE